MTDNPTPDPEQPEPEQRDRWCSACNKPIEGEPAEQFSDEFEGGLVLDMAACSRNDGVCAAIVQHIARDIWTNGLRHHRARATVVELPPFAIKASDLLATLGQLLEQRINETGDQAPEPAEQPEPATGTRYGNSGPGQAAEPEPAS